MLSKSDRRRPLYRIKLFWSSLAGLLQTCVLSAASWIAVSADGMECVALARKKDVSCSSACSASPLSWVSFVSSVRAPQVWTSILKIICWSALKDWALNVLETKMNIEVTWNKSSVVIRYCCTISILKRFYLSMRLIYVRRIVKGEHLMMHRARTSKKHCFYLYE